VTVRDPNGAVVAGATIGLNLTGGSPGICVVTDSVGTYTFSNISSGIYVLGVSPPSSRSDIGYIPDGSVTLTGGTVVERGVSLPRRDGSGGGGGGATGNLPTGNAGVRVTVRDASGAAVPGAMVGLSLSSGGGMGVTTNANGISEFTGIASGTYTLGVGVPANRADLGYGSNDSVTLVGGTTVERTVTLASRTTIGTATLRVTVRDIAGHSVAGAMVGVAFPGGGVVSPGMTVDASGVATFSNIAAGTYQLGVSPPADRADLGSISALPVALAIGATRDETVVLPARVTGTVMGATDAASVCGVVYDPDRNALSGIMVGISSTTEASRMGTSTMTDTSGRYCFKNLVPGKYIMGAATPASRIDLMPSNMASLSLTAGTVAGQDFTFNHAPQILPGTTTAVVPPSLAPLPTIERCVRDALGAGAYEGMRSGKRKPSPEEYERARHCFTLTVIGETQPVASPIGAPVVPPSTTSVVVLPAPVVAPAVPPPTFDDRCETRDLPRVKRDLARTERALATIEREVDRLRTANVAVPTDVGLFIVRVRDLVKQVQAAATCESAFTAGEELPDLMTQLQTSVTRVSQLRFAPQVIASFDRAVRRFLDHTKTGIRRLERAQFTVADMQTRLAEAEQQLKDCRVSATAALTAIDPELFERTMRSCFEILGEGREVEELTGALANARAFLANRIAATLQRAARVTRALERQQKGSDEVKQFADVLRQRRDEALVGIRSGKLKRDELADTLAVVIAAFGNLDDAFNRALGTSAYATVVGNPPSEIAAPKLDKSSEDFFTRE